MYRIAGLLALLWIALAAPLAAQSVTLVERSAVVWSPHQTVRGHATGTDAEGTLFVDGTPVAFPASGDFAVPVTLGEGTTEIVACAAPAGGAGTVCSDTLRWTMGYRLRPEVSLVPEVEGRTVVLHGRVLENPEGLPLSFAWSVDGGNPQGLSLTVVSDTVATVEVPSGAEAGEYYFDVSVTASDGDVSTARTFVTVETGGSIRPFELERDHAAWVDRAMIYEVTPYSFSFEGRWADVTARIPELVDLGVNTLWVQPVFRSRYGGQGYDITDYFALRSDLGTEADLRQLVETAHAHGLRVLFDFVPNQTSVHHPYAQDAVAHGPASHYFDFYQRQRTNARYANNERTRREGQMTFVHYFDGWPEMVNLNYDNPEVVRWMIEAGRYWIRQFDIDGYRIDVAWGPNARTPAAMQQWRAALKRLKPEALLLGEDAASLPHAFDGRFDVAYDWYYDPVYVSHWTWHTAFSPTTSLTLFNTPNERDRARLLRDALTNRGQGFPPEAKVLRFMENNDVYRFIAAHKPQEVERTKLAATLIFSLPGVPLLYNGQEIGYGAFSGQAGHPYETLTVFHRHVSIRGQDRLGLFSYYEHLLLLRKTYPALYSDNYQEIDVAPDPAADVVFAFHRWLDDEHLFSVLNLSRDPADARLTLPVDQLALDGSQTYYLTDLLTGDYLAVTRDDLAALPLTLPGYTARLFVLDDEVVRLPVGVAPPVADLPEAFTLSQNYPNPFNPRTVIGFTVPTGGPVRLVVYDVLGREVARLVDGVEAAGRREVVFDGRGLGSGLYVYRLEAGGRVLKRTMHLVK